MLSPTTALKPGLEFDRAHRKSSENTDPLVGTRLSEHYLVKEKIGEGGMGKIYLAEDQRLGKRVVVKMFPPAFAHKADLRTRFMQEARLASQMEHENIVGITDLVMGKPPFYVMEYLPGKDLATLLEEHKRLAWDERTKGIFVQVCRALGVAHAKGVVHRDIKPENIRVVMRDDGGEIVKVLDFGIAKLLSDTSSSGEERSDGEGPADIALGKTGRCGLTNADFVLGTPHYMAPEQALGTEVDHRADIYSLGVVMYEALTGTTPFEVPEEAGTGAAKVAKILEMHVKEPVVPPRTRNPDANIPEEVEAIIMAALQKDPGSRFQSIDDMRAAIMACAAPKHRPKPIMRQDAASEGRSAEGLTVIRRRQAEGRKWARVRTGIIIGTLVAAAAAGVAAAEYFGFLEPAAESVSVDEQPEQKVQPEVTDGE